MRPAVRFGTICIALLLGGKAYAQAIDCTALKDDKDRLACFDKLPKQSAKSEKSKLAADPIVEKARATVAKSLKDPPSARFDSVIRKSEAVCGFVNAKNSYGGYAGRTRFAYILKSGAVFLEVPITTLTPANLDDYQAADAALTRYCPGVKSPFIRN